MGGTRKTVDATEDLAEVAAAKHFVEVDQVVLDLLGLDGGYYRLA